MRNRHSLWRRREVTTCRLTQRVRDWPKGTRPLENLHWETRVDIYSTLTVNVKSMSETTSLSTKWPLQSEYVHHWNRPSFSRFQNLPSLLHNGKPPILPVTVKVFVLDCNVGRFFHERTTSTDDCTEHTVLLPHYQVSRLYQWCP